MWTQDSKRAEKGTGSGCGWVFCLFGQRQHVVGAVSESRQEHGNVSVERDVHGIVGEGSESQGKRRREIAMVAISTLLL